MSLCSCYIYHSGTCASMAVTVPGVKANSRDTSAKAGMSEHNRQSKAGQSRAEQSSAERGSAVSAATQNRAEVGPALRRGWMGFRKAGQRTRNILMDK